MSDLETGSSPAVDDAELPGGGGHSARILAVVVGVALVGLIAILALGGPGTDAETSRLIDKRVPEVAGPTLDGKTFDIDAERGRWVVVNFFATWCPPCVAEHPELVALEQYGADTGNVAVVSIVFDDDPAKVAALFAKLGGSWPVLSDPTLPVTFQVAQVPESFIVDPSGVVVAHATGGIKADEVIRLIEGAG
jgi:cytochrome c biogenesis protein CcmG/thiol:disulfide interchange protein DsbE